MNLTHTEALPIISVGNTCSIKNIYKISLNLNYWRVDRSAKLMLWSGILKQLQGIKCMMCICCVVGSKLTQHLYIFLVQLEKGL